MYYPDLSIYCYGYEGENDPNVLNIGSLDVKYPFPRMKASEKLLDELFQRCLQCVHKTRGYHVCQFCHPSSFGLKVSRNGKNNVLGSCEIRVESHDGKIYAAPDLIYHYIAEHKYEPPQEFVDALFQ